MQKAQTKLGRSFYWLNVTQFLGALNDNVFKLLLIAFVIGVYGSESASNVTALAGAVFVVPFLVFSAYAGKLADRFSKSSITVAVKLAEATVMALAVAAFLLGTPAGLYVVLFLMATQSAFFGPSKYGIVPELVRKEQLSRGNALLEALTYLAIVIGAGVVPVLLYATRKHYDAAALLCVLISAAGLAASIRIERTPPGGATSGASIIFIKDIWRTLAAVRRRDKLLLMVTAAAYFLLVGAFIRLNAIPYGIEQLGFDETQAAYVFLPGAIGIGVGSFLAGRLSGRSVELGLVPVGALGLTVCCAMAGLVPVGVFPAFLLVLLMGASAGLFIVPVHAYIQLRSPRRRRGQVIAASNFLGWVGVLLASGLLYLLSSVLGLSAREAFLATGVMTLGLTIAVGIFLMQDWVRFALVLVTRLCYRPRVFGLDNVPVEGGALIVCNHVSWADPLLLVSAAQRHIRFVMDKGMYDVLPLKPIFRLGKVILISAHDPPKQLVAALKQARAALNDGSIVCVFAEGAMTRTGMPRAFKGGFRWILKNSDYKIIPAYIGGMWGSIFSYYHGKILSALPRKLAHPVSVHFGEPMPADAPMNKVRQKVLELSCEHFAALTPLRRSLTDHFVRAARKNWRKRCICDAAGNRLDYGQTLTATVALAKQIAKLTDCQDMIGVLLPPSVGAALANLAIALLRKPAVNLNYVTSSQARQLAIEECGIKRVITSRTFLYKCPNLGPLPDPVFMEDLIEKVDSSTKVKAYLKARFMPRRILTQARRFRADDLATVIFTSGSSGRPKGVMLSHHNILSNIEAIRMVFKIRPNDNVCAVLPLFHSFGYTCTLWLPMVSGVSAAYVPNPLDGKTVGQTVRDNGSTLLFATPTFLLNYTRQAQSDDFSTVRFLVTGAEKLKQNIADSFQAKFGIRPVEGYGTTELSPVVSLNLPDVELGGVHQIAGKAGTVGHPLPGVAAKIGDMDTGEDLDVGETGLLFIKGPNVMLGYLNRQQQTAEVLKDGWYNTGDIGHLDEDGFLTITGRLSRFSKIGGEMVPHIAIEQAYLEGLGTSEQLVAVTGVPTEKKGEELVVLYLEKAGDAHKLHRIISRSSLPNMWKPRRDNYFKADALPLLGSGKLDLIALRQIALAAKQNSGPGGGAGET